MQEGDGSNIKLDERRLNIRLSPQVSKMVDELMEKYSGKYSNPSHLVRCGIIKLHQMHKQGLLHSMQVE